MDSLPAESEGKTKVTNSHISLPQKLKTLTSVESGHRLKITTVSTPITKQSKEPCEATSVRSKEDSAAQTSAPLQIMDTTKSLEKEKVVIPCQPQKLFNPTPRKSGRKAVTPHLLQQTKNLTPPKSGQPFKKSIISVPLQQQSMDSTQNSSVSTSKFTTPQQQPMVSTPPKSGPKVKGKEGKDTTTHTPLLQQVADSTPRKSVRKAPTSSPSLLQQIIDPSPPKSGRKVNRSSIPIPLQKPSVDPPKATSVTSSEVTTSQSRNAMISTPPKSTRRRKYTNAHTPLLLKPAAPTHPGSGTASQSPLPQQTIDSTPPKSGQKLNQSPVPIPLQQPSVDPTETTSVRKSQVATPQPRKAMDSTPPKSVRRRKDTIALTLLPQQAAAPTHPVSGSVSQPPLPQQTIDPTPSKTGRKIKNTRARLLHQLIDSTETTTLIVANVTTIQPQQAKVSTPPKSVRRGKDKIVHSPFLQQSTVPTPPKSGRKVNESPVPIPLQQTSLDPTEATSVMNSGVTTPQLRKAMVKSQPKSARKRKDTTSRIPILQQAAAPTLPGSGSASQPPLPQQTIDPTPPRSGQKVNESPVPIPLQQPSVDPTEATNVTKSEVTTPQPRKVMVKSQPKSARRRKDTTSHPPLIQQAADTTETTAVRMANVTTLQPQQAMVLTPPKSVRKGKDNTARALLLQQSTVQTPTKCRRKFKNSAINIQIQPQSTDSTEATSVREEKVTTPQPQPTVSRSGRKVKAATTHSPLLQQSRVPAPPKSGRKVTITQPLPQQTMDPTPPKSGRKVKNTRSRLQPQSSDSTEVTSVRETNITTLQPQQAIDSTPSKFVRGKGKVTTARTLLPLATVPTPRRKVKDATICVPLQPQSTDSTDAIPVQKGKVTTPQPKQAVDTTSSKSGRKVKDIAVHSPLLKQTIVSTPSKSGRKVKNVAVDVSLQIQSTDSTKTASVEKVNITTLEPHYSNVATPSKSGRKVKDATARSSLLQQAIVPTPSRSGRKLTSHHTPLARQSMDLTPDKNKPLVEKKSPFARKNKAKPVILPDEEKHSESKSLLRLKLVRSSNEDDRHLEKNSQIVRGSTYIVVRNTEKMCLLQGETSARSKTNSAPERSSRKAKTPTGSICPPGQTTPTTTMPKRSKKCVKNEDLESASTPCGKAVKHCKVEKDQLVINTPVVCNTANSVVGNIDELLFPQGEAITESPVASTSTKSVQKRKSRAPSSTTTPKNATKELQYEENSRSRKKSDKDSPAVVVFLDSKQPECEETINNCESDGIPPQIDTVDSQIYDPENEELQAIEKFNDTDRKVKEANRQTRTRTSSIPQSQVVELVQQDETELRQLSSKRKSTGITPTRSSGAPKWDTVSALRLLLLLKEEGFDGNFKELVHRFPGHSDNSLRYFFGNLRDENKKKESKCKVATVSRKLIKLIRDDQESQSLGINIPLFLEFYSIFGNHPDPSQIGEVDYPAILRCVASLARGYVPKELNPSSAAKLDSILDILFKNLNVREGLHPIPEGMQMPTKKEPINREERNVILARRRSACWSEEEIAAREELLSPDLATVRKRYLSLTCFNPFKFPPE